MPRKVGRPKFVVTPEIQKQVEQLAGIGLPQEQIGAIVGCSDDTLRKHLSDELLRGSAKANAKIAQTLFTKATSGEGDTTALIFWAKTRMGWKEKSQVEVSGPNDGPVEISETKTKLLAGIPIPKKEGE